VAAPCHTFSCAVAAAANSVKAASSAQAKARIAMAAPPFARSKRRQHVYFSLFHYVVTLYPGQEQEHLERDITQEIRLPGSVRASLPR
jgi:hypothetical protein